MDSEALCSSSIQGNLPVTSDKWMMRPCGRVMVAWHEEVMESCANRLSIDVKQLHPQRTTVIFDSRGRQVVQDDWMSPKANTLSQVVERWRGYTFFRVDHPSAAAGIGAQANSSRATATRFGGGYPNDGRHADERPQF